MNSTKLFNILSDYLKRMCDSVDEIKGNRMTRYSLCALKRDNFIKNYELDYRREMFVDDFFVDIFYIYIDEMEKILNKTRFFKKFYKKYMADSIKLANSRDFLDHSSLDAIMLPIEAALFRFFNYGKSIECRKLRDKTVWKIRRKINRIEISCYNFTEDSSKTYMKFKDLFNKKTYPSLNPYSQIRELNQNLDYLFEEMFFKSAFSILFVEFIRDSLKTNSKLIKDTKFDELKQDIYLYFVRNTGSYLKIYDLLSKTFDKIQKFSNDLSIARNKVVDVHDFYTSESSYEYDEDPFEKSFLRDSKELIKKYNIISVFETLHEFCYHNYKLVGLTANESKDIRSEILFISDKLKNNDLSDFSVVNDTLVHLNSAVKLMWGRVKEIIKTKESLDLPAVFNEYIENSIKNNDSRLFVNPVFGKHIKG